MAFNISGFFQNIVSGSMDNQSADGVQNNTANTQAAGTPAGASQAASVTAASLASKLAGDTLTGTVSSVRNQQVTLTLQNGENVLAKLASEIQLQIGQTMTFMIQENRGDFIALKPLVGDAQQMVLVQKALEAAGAAYNESNTQLVARLLEQNMPIDSVTINEMMKNIQKFPDVSFDTIANLVKLHMPVTAENIQQYEAYTHYEHNMAEQLNSLPEGFSEAISGLINNTSGEVGEAGVFLKNMTNILYSDMPDTNEALPVSNYIDTESRNVLAKEIVTVFGESANELAEQLKNGETSVKEVLTQLSEQLEQLENTQKNMPNIDREMNLPQTKEQLTQLFASKEMKQLIKAGVSETMYLTPEAVSNADNVKGFYKRLRSNLSAAIDEVKERLSGNSQLSKDLNEIKSNIDFMNDLNRNMTYFQMPVKFSEGTGNGELYVFTNKKSLRNGTDNVSALLHLDMENLGPVDIYVKLSGKNVTTNFCLESEEMLDFIYEHIDQLNARLEALGYMPHVEMKVVEAEEQFDLGKDFLNSAAPSLSTSQYIFDIKA